MLHNYLFENKTTGEFFICQAADVATAFDILEEEGFSITEIEFIRKLSYTEAELSGLDTYWCPVFFTFRRISSKVKSWLFLKKVV